MKLLRVQKGGPRVPQNTGANACQWPSGWPTACPLPSICRYFGAGRCGLENRYASYLVASRVRIPPPPYFAGLVVGSVDHEKGAQASRLDRTGTGAGTLRLVPTRSPCRRRPRLSLHARRPLRLQRLRSRRVQARRWPGRDHRRPPLRRRLRLGRGQAAHSALRPERQVPQLHRQGEHGRRAGRERVRRAVGARCLRRRRSRQFLRAADALRRSDDAQHLRLERRLDWQPDCDLRAERIVGGRLVRLGPQYRGVRHRRRGEHRFLPCRHRRDLEPRLRRRRLGRRCSRV